MYWPLQIHIFQDIVQGSFFVIAHMYRFSSLIIVSINQFQMPTKYKRAQKQFLILNRQLVQYEKGEHGHIWGHKNPILLLHHPIFEAPPKVLKPPGREILFMKLICGVKQTNAN